jgi:hypothetical protein
VVGTHLPRGLLRGTQQKNVGRYNKKNITMVTCGKCSDYSTRVVDAAVDCLKISITPTASARPDVLKLGEPVST